jgi:nitroreductase
LILDIMKLRTSVRNFSSQDIPEKDLVSILEAGRLAPSGANEQPWIFGVIKDQKTIHKISQNAYQQEWIKSANVLLVLCVKIIDDQRGARNIQKQRFPKYEKEIDSMGKELYSALNLEEHQTKIPGTIMMLQALELGIHSTWISRFDVFAVKKILNLPELCIPSEILALGYPETDLKYAKKKELTELVFYEEYQG